MTADPNIPVRTREGDNPDVAARLKAVRAEGRKRTLALSVIASGVVSLFIANLVDMDATNAQVDRSRKNCELIQDDRRDRAAVLNRDADQVLGNQHAKPPIPPFKFEGTPFEEFKPLLVGQASEDRKRAKAILERVENCKLIFRKRGAIPFVE